MPKATAAQRAARPRERGSTRKEPQRKPSLRKLEMILEAADRLLEDCAVNDVSMAMIARQAGIARTTLYDFFPAVMAVYEQVAQRHVLESYEFMIRYVERAGPRTLPAVVDTLVDAAVEFFNGNAAARKTMLGTGALEMHLIVEDFEGLCAGMYHQLYKGRWDFVPLGPNDPFRNLATIQSALYTNSVQRHGTITPYMAAQVKAAGLGYLREALGDLNALHGLPERRAG